MATKTVKVLDIFQLGVCGVCGVEEVNQYFNINDNYIGYCGIFLPLCEILRESLGFNVEQNAEQSLEICLECKDKVVKIYHFRKKVSDVQRSLEGRSRSSKQQKTKLAPTEKNSKIVQNIHQIIENYVEKCSVTAIQVNENSGRLIVESSSAAKKKSAREEEADDMLNERDGTFESESLIIKEEPLDRSTLIISNQFGNYEPASSSGEDEPESHKDDSDTWRLSDIKRKRRSTAKPEQTPSAKKPKKLLKPALKEDVNRLQDVVPNANVTFPITSENELNKFSREITENESYEQRLGMELVRITKARNGEEMGTYLAIRAMMKILMTENVYLRMNRSGKITKCMQGKPATKMIKAPESLMRFLAKYSGELTGVDEEQAYIDCKRVISRLVSDNERDRKRYKNKFNEKEMDTTGADYDDDDDDPLY